MNKLSASFRDPAGFLFKHQGQLLRQINPIAKEDYDQFMESGLYDYLIKKGLIVGHKEVDNVNPDAYKTIQPDLIPFISYPYEWSFDQLKDAALLTLRIQKIAIKHGMSLKDASAYNVQFLGAKPIFIDSLSFEPYEEGKAWVAYKQFCQHFLAPLALASYRDFRLNRLLSDFIDGLPLDLASRLLPWRTKLKFSLASHIHWHAKAQHKHAADAKDAAKSGKISQTGLLGIVSNLESTIKKLRWKPGETEWGDYYNNTNYQDSAFAHKKELVKEFLVSSEGNVLWDLGANDGTFSSIGLDLGMQTLAFDIDPIAVNKNYVGQRTKEGKQMLPLLMDLTNPSAGIGWDHTERDSLADRGPVDCVMALALIHHLAISNNLPLERIASYFRKLGNQLIIEFVPKEDSKVQILLATREDIFPTYNVEGFEAAFSHYFSIQKKEAVKGSERTLYLMKAL